MGRLTVNRGPHDPMSKQGPERNVERVQQWKDEAHRLVRDGFTSQHAEPVLLLRWVVEGDLGRGNTPQATHIHNVRATLKDRLSAAGTVPDRRPIDQERIFPIKHPPERMGMASVFSVGRQATCDTCINDYTVSGRHGRMHWMSRIGRWMFEDLGSTNGSWINSVHLQSKQKALIETTDEIQLGRLVFLFLDPTDLHRYLIGDY